MRFLSAILLSGGLLGAPLPTPTPGLPASGNEVVFAALQQGQIVKTDTVDGQTYSIANIQNFLILLNDQGHAILIARFEDGNLQFALGASATDPFGGVDVARVVRLDNMVYFIKAIPSPAGIVLAVYNGKHNIVCAFFGPCQVMIPDSSLNT
jgi:hypothetical protein